ncbi:MAG: siphovirus ReqiPepy6 Gp37-like family protein [Brevibacillus sp.]|nr:siphovirus ReqiPepy6 Gp37-like family protein [Brevibacillus sp.]
MQPIRIIDTNFNLLGEVDTYTSLQWIRRWHKPGEFELHLNPTMQNADKLVEDAIIFKASNPGEAGIIRHREINVLEDGTEELIVKGSFLSGLVGRRITYPPAGSAYHYLNAPVETIMKSFVDANCINSADPARVIPNLVNAPDLARGGTVQYQTRYKQLDEELEKLSLSSGLGWHITLDVANAQFVFDVLAGRDLTAGQDTLPPAIFSTDYDNIKSQAYVNSAVGYKNMAVVGGQGEGAERKIVTVGNDLSGLQRFETFVDARDIGTTESGSEPLTEEQIEQMLVQRGQEKLAEFARSLAFESQIVNKSNLVYRVDYDLGDIVTIQNRKWGVTMDARITEVKEVYEPGGVYLEATFGNSLPTITEKIKRTIAEKGR